MLLLKEASSRQRKLFLEFAEFWKSVTLLYDSSLIHEYSKYYLSSSAMSMNGDTLEREGTREIFLIGKLHPWKLLLQQLASHSLV